MGIAEQAASEVSPESVFDYEADDTEQAPISEDRLAQLTELCREQIRLERQIADLAAQLKVKVDAHNEIAMKRIPQIAKECRFKRFDLSTGAVLKIKESLKAKLYEDEARRAEQIAWLEAHGQGAIVKRKVVVEFEKKDEALAKKLVRDLARRKTPLNVTRKDDVHNGTLVAALNEMKRAGAAIDLALFQAFELREAKITLPDAK